MTRDRIPEVIDPQPLLATVRDNLQRFDLRDIPTTIDMCPALQDASGA